MSILNQVKKAIRKPLAHSGYALQTVMTDGEILCNPCLKTEFKAILGAHIPDDPCNSWHVASIEIYWEGPMIFCCHCNAPIYPEYGNPANNAD